MHLIRGLKNWPDNSPCVVTIGNFDGVHLGHQAMFAATCKKALQLALPATVVSFEPLPHEYFAPDNSPLRIQGLRDKVHSISAAGIDRLVLLDLSDELAAMSAEDFVSQTLVKKINARHIIVGDDFRFGHKRSGNITTFEELAAENNFSVDQTPTLLHTGQRVSSTRLRETLQAGQLPQAAELIGRPYRISGRVVHGEKIGRQLGFPTANIALKNHQPPLRGVFAVQATHMQTGQCVPGVANLGVRPTIGGRKLLLEVHALDGSPDWYGQHLAIDFMAQVRSEKRFDSLDELKAQITLDAHEARALLSTPMAYTIGH